MSLASKSERDALFVAADSQSHHTIFVAPPYMTLFKQITQIRFQCYIDGQPAREGQTLWMRDELSVPCNMSNRVFACGNIIIITKVSKQDAGKYKCVNQDGTFFVVAVYGAYISPKTLISSALCVCLYVYSSCINA